MTERDIEESLPDKEKNLSEWYSMVLEKAEIVDIRYGVKGFIVYMPYGMEIMKNIIRLFESELEKTGHRPVLFPVVIPESNLRKEEEHVKGFAGQVFWITHAGYSKLEEKLALRPTSETAMYPIYSLWIKSYKDLPLKAYQTVAVYRYETKATRPLLRGREFLWIEAHNVFRSREEAYKQTLEDADIFKRVSYEKLGIPFIHVKREEFDKFPGAEDTFAFDTLMPDGRVLQIGTTHYLGTKFSKVFDIKFHDVDGKYRYGHQTCYGIGLSRILASLIMIHGDSYGMVLPFDIAPLQIIIIPIPKTGYDLNKIFEYCDDIQRELIDKGYKVKVDKSEKTPGEKYYYYDMRGIPIRIEVGPFEVDNRRVTLFRRDLRMRVTIPREDLFNKIERLRVDITENLRRKAEDKIKNTIKYVSNLDELKKYSEEGFSIFKVHFCGNEECAERIKNETGGFEVRGSDVSEDGFNGECIMCGKETSKIVYLAKAY
ncbi:proline--tRNA ligase [Candidatus Geothermarchaeota archaeon]|nr:MAG: proline--tRNA ligase [Candidatus Geothermarchaeota archaeon]